MGWTEASTIQKSLIEWAEEADWEHLPGNDLPRDEHDVVIEEWAREALLALNPELVDDPESADLVLHEINQAILDANNGLVAANELLTVMLRGDHSFPTIDGVHVPRRLIDFEDPDNNRFVVADEVTITGAVKPRRFDVVYYVNGFPLVVAETKSPVKHQVSWVNAAKDIYGTYEEEYPNFFATNVFNVATEGLEFRMAPIRAYPDPDSEIWAPWGSTDDDPKEGDRPVSCRACRPAAPATRDRAGDPQGSRDVPARQRRIRGRCEVPSSLPPVRGCVGDPRESARRWGRRPDLASPGVRQD